METDTRGGRASEVLTLLRDTSVVLVLQIAAIALENRLLLLFLPEYFWKEPTGEPFVSLIGWPFFVSFTTFAALIYMWDVFHLPLWKGEPATVAGKRVVNQYLLCGLAMSGLLALVLGTAASSSPANIVFPTISTAPLPHAFQPLMRMLPAALLGIMVVCVATAHWYMRVDKWIRSAQERCEKAGTSVP